MTPSAVPAVAPDPAGTRRFAPRAPGWRAFWGAAAEALADWTEREPGVAPVVVVPRGSLVSPLRRALQQRAGAVGRPWAPPVIRSPMQWADLLAPARPVDGLARTLGLLQALDDVMPERQHARTPAERLSFAGGLLEVLDAFSLAGAAGRLDDPAWVARVAAAFGSPTAEARLRDDLALLARIAAGAADGGHDPVAQGVERMRRVADAWARSGARVAWIAWQPPDPLEAVLLRTLEDRSPPGRLLRLEPDWAALGAAVPLLRAAWPECFDAPPRPLRERRQRWRASPDGPRPLILHAGDREREAQLAAQWVHATLQRALSAGRPAPRLAIVALDRWLARRVRAILERAGILLDDHEGWLLSTTVAATAAMGWLDAVASDGYYDDVLNWLDSRYVRPPGGRELRAWVEQRATRHRWLRGWEGLRGGPEADGPPEAVARLIELAAAQGRPQTLRSHLDRLEQAMRWASSPRRLAADAAGRQLLSLLEALRRAADGPAHARSLSFAEFRALLALTLERHRFFGAIESPVELLTPIDAAGRDFDGVLVLGAADGALPSLPPPLPMVNEPLRTMLGLPTAIGTAARQQRDLALLLSLADTAAITCRTDPSDGTRPGPWVERIEAIVDDRPLAERIDRPGRERTLVPTPSTRPAVALAAVPARLSVGGVERLVACPFRFLAQDGWRLREPDEPVDVPGVRERGQLVHEILERFHAAAHAAGLAFSPGGRDGVRALLLEVTASVAERELRAGGGTLGELAEWRATLDAYVTWAIGDAAHGWRWKAGEQDGHADVGWDGPGGARTVRIEGRLDRLDEGPSGLRIVDYKLGSPDRLRKIASAPDTAAQLALYAWFASAQGGVSESGYLSLRREEVRWVPLAKDTAEVLDAWREAMPRYLARIDAGTPMVASGSECGHCASRGLCRKGHWT
jgi:ATP-dependent helicase/nuclease subunit B